jgi:tetratricopeptide (TPR) repeat protein
MMLSLLLFVVFQNAPESIVALWNAANADMQAQRWSEAAAKYEQVLKQDETHIPSLFSLAACYTNLNDPKRAAEAYSKLLAQDGAVFEARVNYAWLLQRSGDDSAAEEQMDKAIALRPDDPKTDMIAASFFTAQNHFERAYTHLQQAERKGLLTPELLIALSQAEIRLHNESKSREYLERAAQLDPNNRDLLHDLGIAYRKAGQLDKAIATLQPLLPDTRLELALSYFSNKDYSEAGKLFEELVRLEPANADYLYMLGQSYFETKRYADAVAALSRLLALQPSYVEAYATLGSVRYLQEDWAGAATALLKFLEFKPDHAFSHFVLATCFDKLGNLKEALVHYNRFLALDDGSSDVRSFQARQRAKALEARLR